MSDGDAGDAAATLQLRRRRFGNTRKTREDLFLLPKTAKNTTFFRVKPFSAQRTLACEVPVRLKRFT